MARIYQFPDNQDEPIDVEGSRLKSFDPVTRKALLKFWISAPGIILAAVVLYYLSRGRIEPSVAILGALLVTAAAIVLLFVMNRSLLSMRVLSQDDARVEQRLDKVLSQLDDRFAIFHNVQVGEHWVEHIIVGPSGNYVVKSSATLDKDGWARSADVEQLIAETRATDDLIGELLPQVALQTEGVLCVQMGTTARVEQENLGVWILPADKLAVSLIKRSSSEGAIGKNVNETGAFSSDTMQSAAVERALAHHWNIPTRRNRTDYIPPADLTEGGNPPASPAV